MKVNLTVDHRACYRILPATVLAVALAGGCQTAQSPSKETLGTVGGAAAGAAVGSQIGSGSGRTAAMIGGALLGGFLGKQAGARMDQQDRRQAAYALENTQTDETVSWTNPDTGAEYAFTPTRTYESPQGYPCREFTTQAYIDGGTETIRGTACRQPDGTWNVVE